MTEQTGKSIDGNAYEVLRRRLEETATELRAAALELDGARTATFGRAEVKVAGQATLHTHAPAVPRDIIRVGDDVLFGFSTEAGVDHQTRVCDVLSMHRVVRSDEELEVADTASRLLDSPEFVRDLEELYRYFSGTWLERFRHNDGRLYLSFRVGATKKDRRVLRFGRTVDGRLRYVDNAGHQELSTPPRHDFAWRAVSRETYVEGKHPHISIEDVLFVETVGGDLTIKLENDTSSPDGVYSEPVVDRNQSLGDAKIRYARASGFWVLSIRPYREDATRYLIYNPVTGVIERVDEIGTACRELPRGQGIVFPGGYALRDGTVRRFDGDWSQMAFDTAVASATGEAVLFAFHRDSDHTCLLMSYDTMQQTMQSPIVCRGWAMLEDGTLLVLKASDYATTDHLLQIWSTPFGQPQQVARAKGLFGRVGNAEVVRGIGDVLGLARLARDVAPTVEVYRTLAATARKVADEHFWLSDDEANRIGALVDAVGRTAKNAIAEFEKIAELEKSAADSLAELSKRTRRVCGALEHDSRDSVEEWVSALDRLRKLRGEVAVSRDIRRIDRGALDVLDAELERVFGKVARGAAEFLGTERALAPWSEQIETVRESVPYLETSVDGAPLAADIAAVGDGLQLLMEVAQGLPVEDPRARAELLSTIGDVLGEANRARADLEAKLSTLRKGESAEEFALQVQLVGQSLSAALSVCDTPERCDEQLGRLLLQIEEAEARYGDDPEYLVLLAEKREEVRGAIEERRARLVERVQERVEQLDAAAGRLLSSIARRAESVAEVGELLGYFASDAAVLRVRRIVGDLEALGEAVRAGDVKARLDALREQSVQTLRDRLDIGSDDGVRFGEHVFGVQKTPADVVVVGSELRVIGTDYRRPLGEDLANRPLVSESDDVYRAEYLAMCSLMSGEAVADLVAARHDEGYERGVHDEDARRIAHLVNEKLRELGELRFTPRVRAEAIAYWLFRGDSDSSSLRLRARNVVRLAGRDPGVRSAASSLSYFGVEVRTAAGNREQRGAGVLKNSPVSSTAAAYLVEALAAGDGFAGPQSATDVDPIVGEILDAAQTSETFLEVLDEVAPWFQGGLEEALSFALERKGLLVAREASVTEVIEGLRGRHPRVVDGALSIRVDEWIERLTKFATEEVAEFRRRRVAQTRAVEVARNALSIGDFVPDVPSSFVRNRLIDDVYLPLVGQNFARQIGAAGDESRSDRSGLLLLVSPPGYGKTTLMEYVAARVGLLFVKVDGPSLGHEVTSLDPSSAPNLTARREVEKLNLALELGNNVMLYIDDIQHTNPEFLQKFVPLCDGTRRIEGVREGKSATFDLRGKRFAVVMAGNPYTESGERFRVPDMLANRADTYNLGDVLSGRERAFALSYIENALASHPLTAPLSSRGRADIERFVAIAEGEDFPLSDFDFEYSAAEAEDIVGLMRHMLRLRDIVGVVNKAYIASAATHDDYRVEPRFGLQGSYRNMNRIAEKLSPAMNDEEVMRLVADHYRQEAQTLTSGAEQNLLKFGELLDTLSPEEVERWAEIKADFVRKRRYGSDEDPVARIAAPLVDLVEKVGGLAVGVDNTELRALRRAVERAEMAMTKRTQSSGSPDDLVAALRALVTVLERRELEVRVTGDLPRTMEETLQHQLAIIESSLVPLARALMSDVGPAGPERDAG